MITPRLKSRAQEAPAGGAWLAPLSGRWIDAACAQLALKAVLVRVTVVSLRGSAPREPGASMLVADHGTLGTIGGGRLEWHAAREARRMLAARDGAPVRLEELILGPQLGQCCGGRVELWLERLTRQDLPWLQAAALNARHRGAVAIETRFTAGAVSRQVRPLSGAPRLSLRRDAPGEVTLLEPLGWPRPPLWIFGAGHVGQALVRLLGELALFDILWIDPRPDLLPAALPDTVEARVCDAPAALLGAARADTRYVVLTHDHALDYELCRAILERGDASWLGLIGSASKAARFRSRLLREGMDPRRLAGLTCPIGIPGILSKLPVAIAIAIAAQLLQQGAAAAAADTVDAPTCDGACGNCGAPRREDT
jgi:xanthine dehydrogenase accessory factor